MRSIALNCHGHHYSAGQLRPQPTEPTLERHRDLNRIMFPDTRLRRLRRKNWNQTGTSEVKLKLERAREVVSTKGDPGQE